MFMPFRLQDKKKPEHYYDVKKNKKSNICSHICAYDKSMIFCVGDDYIVEIQPAQEP